MLIGNFRLHPQKLICCLSIVGASLGVIIPQAAYPQTTSVPVIRILRVTVAGGTTFKLQENWFRQSTEITDNNKKCGVRTGEKFFVSSISDNRNNNAEYREGNRVEKVKDYYTVTFEKPLPCNRTNQTWYIFKNHVEQLQAIPIRR
ncbi:hypothetical protein ACN23B_21400 [Anabaena sp. FACHB-709]|uniref:Uncharacterized protein n=2 Tax=Nostocaceae TaxID=1162 RepID=A0A1Z4KLM9_ANAVA|nr:MULTISPECIES: hypothetical protein [Nostocaceae]BAY69880.1 hypothetical protein NIES23_26800 [Trichormus variabilis NIES-23]HBW33176.1 hypothetical protein [Nostoc sp. UBA8866]MBD2172751.1 hypothetical protein [Anabaena cylindrica FACHB-318]MBD2264624.1 hypothetical protein [Anabaena sp. FACHB-709]MBD2273680.1 hypothetical protein [Nostoc sp. PCC 7120 = FACHB-418]